MGQFCFLSTQREWQFIPLQYSKLLHILHFSNIPHPPPQFFSRLFHLKRLWMPAFAASNENKAAYAEYKRLPTFCSLPSHSTPSLQTSPNQAASIKNSRIFIYQRKCPASTAAILRQKCADNPWKCAKKTHISTTYRHIFSLSPSIRLAKKMGCGISLKDTTAFYGLLSTLERLNGGRW